MDDAFRIVMGALSVNFFEAMPKGFSIYKIDEYSPEKYPAPNLYLDKRDYPQARYIAILQGETLCVPALGVTCADAVEKAINKVNIWTMG